MGRLNNFAIIMSICMSQAVGEETNLPCLSKRNMSSTMLTLVEENNHDLIVYLYEQGYTMAQDGYKALLLAVELGDLDLVNLLLSKEAVSEGCIQLAMSKARQKNHKEIEKILLTRADS